MRDDSREAPSGVRPSSERTAGMESTLPSATRRGRIGLILAPALAIFTYLAIPIASFDQQGVIAAGLSQPGKAVAATGVLMAVLWATEALPIAATALIPIALLPVVTGGALSIKDVAAPYAHDLIFLFMGGFMIALAMQQWGLHRRVALRTVLLVGTRPDRLVAGFMIASAMLSMWVSNTATVLMILPIAMSVIELVRPGMTDGNEGPTPGNRKPCNFAICLMLGTAYGASIGGIGTLIGTPPNLALAAFLKSEFDVEVSFVRWLGVGLPLVMLFLPMAWVLLTKIIYPVEAEGSGGERELIESELIKQGPLSRGERAVLCVFLLTAAAWITRPLLTGLVLPGGFRPLQGLSDAGIAIGAAVLMFAVPIHPARGVFLLSWRQASKLPWGILILFGGGLSLASAVKATGVAEFIGRGAETLHGLPTPLVVLVVITVVVFLTELTSNTATTLTLLPILGAVAVGLGISPILLLVPMAVAASCAFMMPVATPPNAIVFGSGEITIPQMCRAGLWLNLIGIGLVMLLTYTMIGWLLVTPSS